jgi:O-antigen/teichoic acid export membrane protein
LAIVGFAPVGSLKRLAIHGTIWTAVSFGISQILRLGFNLVVTRLLYPELFGLMAVVYTLVNGLTLFCDLGIEPAVVRDPRGAEPAFLHTAWTLQIVRGLGLACFSLLLAWPAAAFYKDSRLLWLLPVVGLINLVAGFNSTTLLTLKRNMDVRRSVTIEIGTQLLSGIVMMVWAWLSPSVWALASGALSASLIRMAWSHLLASGNADRMAWDRGIVRRLLQFGRWIWVSSILTFLALQIDRLILAKMLTWQLLGIYGLASAIAEVPRGLTLAINSNVIFPAYSKCAALPRPEFRARILRHRGSLLAVLALAIAFLTVFGDLIMRLLYDRRYAAGAWMLPVLALGIWPSALANTIDSSLVAIGQPRRVASANLMKILFTALGIPLAFRLMGITGAVLVVALNDLPYYGQIAYGLQREDLSSWAQDLRATALLAAIVALALLTRSALGYGNPLSSLF